MKALPNVLVKAQRRDGFLTRLLCCPLCPSTDTWGISLTLSWPLVLIDSNSGDSEESELILTLLVATEFLDKLHTAVKVHSVIVCYYCTHTQIFLVLYPMFFESVVPQLTTYQLGSSLWAAHVLKDGAILSKSDHSATTMWFWKGMLPSLLGMVHATQ